MKTLKNHVLVYDKDCPLCKAYSGAFVRAGMLDKNGRSAYHEKNEFLFNYLEPERAKNEIALVNTHTGEVKYGTSSLIEIIAHQHKWLKAVLLFPPVLFMLNLLYRFISYNRKLIAPSASMYNENSCTPRFNLFYRSIYLALTVIISGFTLSAFTQPYFIYFGITPSVWQESFVVLGQILFQGIIVYLIAKNRTMDYLGNMMTVSLIGSIFLLPFIPIVQLQFPQFLLIGFLYFILVVGFMLMEHIRRTKLLQLNFIPTITWIIYRIVVLIILTLAYGNA